MPAAVYIAPVKGATTFSHAFFSYDAGKTAYHCLETTTRHPRWALSPRRFSQGAEHGVSGRFMIRRLAGESRQKMRSQVTAKPSSRVAREAPRGDLIFVSALSVVTKNTKQNCTADNTDYADRENKNMPYNRIRAHPRHPWSTPLPLFLFPDFLSSRFTLSVRIRVPLHRRSRFTFYAITHLAPQLPFHGPTSRGCKPRAELVRGKRENRRTAG